MFITINMRSQRKSFVRSQGWAICPVHCKCLAATRISPPSAGSNAPSPRWNSKVQMLLESPGRQDHLTNQPSQQPAGDHPHDSTTLYHLRGRKQIAPCRHPQCRRGGTVSRVQLWKILQITNSKAYSPVIELGILKMCVLCASISSI